MQVLNENLCLISTKHLKNKLPPVKNQSEHRLSCVGTREVPDKWLETTGPTKIQRRNSALQEYAVSRQCRFGRGGADRPTGRDGKPQFVQSYSIFETGIGCVTKTDRNAVELREARPSSERTRMEVQDSIGTELVNDPLGHFESFVTDIKQIFKDPPVLMQDSEVGCRDAVDPLSDVDLSMGRNHRVPYDFFTKSGQGQLFLLQLPDELLPRDLEQIKKGIFGKIQILDTQQVRLVVGEATFDLISPHPATASSDVVLLDQRNDDFIRLNCIGHLDHFMVAVPNLEEFVRIGQ
ncbi:unnamed protein product [Dicrocoelium dendriticum]|nr:unnamed protein product [Dicrocoelium dendriticum]